MKNTLIKPNWFLKYDQIEDAWLNLGDTSRIKFDRNRLLEWVHDPEEDPGLNEIALFRDPHYLSYAAYILFGMELYPFQSVVQHQLWVHPFSILMATRADRDWETD